MVSRISARAWCALLFAVALLGAGAAPAQACDASNQDVFGISPGCIDLRIAAAPTATNLAPDFFQAGGHPYEVVSASRLNAPAANDPVHGTYWPPEPLRDLFLALPAGLTADLSAVPLCGMEDLLKEFPTCPSDSQVGVAGITAVVFGLQTIELPLFAVDPPVGVPARFGINLEGTATFFDVGLEPGGGLSMHSAGMGQLLPYIGIEMALWGAPADPGHDPERACPGELAPTPANVWGTTGPSCPAVLPPRAFLRLPTSCSAPVTTSMRMDSWADPGDFKSGSVTVHRSPGLLGDPAAGSAYPAPYPGLPSENWGPTQKFTDCDRVPFNPSMAVRPHSHAADAPTGLDIEVSFPQQGFTDPEAVAEADLEAGEFELPRELSLNPSVANGLAVCTPAEVDLGSSAAARCPDSSKLGTVELLTPASRVPLTGSIYSAKPDPSRAGAAALPTYIVASTGGATVKLLSEMSVDPDDGHLTANFGQIPEIPISRLKFHFFGGERAPFVTPSLCGRYTAAGSFTPRSGTGPVAVSDVFEITSGPGGGACVNSPGGRPFAPGLWVGGSNPIAGAPTSLTVRMTRKDGEQEASSFDVSLPPGIAASLGGVAICSDAAIALAAGRNGVEELASPSCPASSQVGEVSATVGAGSEPFFLQGGKAYLAGPHEGAPFSFAMILPAVAGPINLGTLAMRLPLRLDPSNGRLTLGAKLPSFRNGVRLNLRQLTIAVNKPNFLTNPTSCRPSSADARIDGDGGARANPSSPFQVLNCDSLGFRPRLRMKALGGRSATKHGANPSLRAALSTRSGDANFKRTLISLPESFQLEPSHLRDICSRAEFRDEACPQGSIYGQVKLTSRLFDESLAGPLYLRQSKFKLPSLVAALDGKLDLDLEMRLSFADGRMRIVLDSLPDLPISRLALTMLGGRKGLFVNNRNLCRSPSFALAEMTGQNDKLSKQRTKLAVPCGGSAPNVTGSDDSRRR